MMASVYRTAAKHQDTVVALLKVMADAGKKKLSVHASELLLPRVRDPLGVFRTVSVEWDVSWESISYGEILIVVGDGWRVRLP